MGHFSLTLRAFNLSTMLFIMSPRNCFASWSTVMAIRSWTGHCTWSSHFTQHGTIASAGCRTEVLLRYHWMHPLISSALYCIDAMHWCMILLYYSGYNWTETSCICNSESSPLCQDSSSPKGHNGDVSLCHSATYHCHSSGLVFGILFSVCTSGDDWSFHCLCSLCCVMLHLWLM